MWPLLSRGFTRHPKRNFGLEDGHQTTEGWPPHSVTNSSAALSLEHRVVDGGRVTVRVEGGACSGLVDENDPILSGEAVCDIRGGEEQLWYRRSRDGGLQV